MEPIRQKGTALQQRNPSGAAARPAPEASPFSLLNLQESLGNQGLLGLLATGRLQRKPAVNQIELHPRLQQAEVRAYDQGHRIVTESWSSLGRGALLFTPIHTP